MLPQSLHIEPAVSQLPLRLRPVARAAAAGSSSDLISLLNLAKGDPESQAPLFLPIFFANLHPRSIPTTDQVDAHPDDFRVPVANAVRALEYLSVIKSIPPDAAVSIWHRVCEWIPFFQCFWEFLPPLSQYSELALAIAILLAIGKLKQDKDIAGEIHQMPSLCIIVARAWKLFILEPEERTPREALAEVCSYLAGHGGGSNLEEFIEGAGGSPSHLSWLTVTHLKRYRSPPHPVSFTDVRCLCCIIMFVAGSHGCRSIQDALQSRGIITTLVRAAAVLSEWRQDMRNNNGLLAESIDQLADNTLLAVWIYLNQRFVELRSPAPLREAVRAGILRVMLVHAGNCNLTTSESLRVLIVRIELYTVYYSVLSSIEPALDDVKDLQTSQPFAQSALFEPWSLFWDTAQSRITIMKYYLSEDCISLKACGNLKCGNIHRKRDLMRCSLCRRQYYCSRRCQATDWNHGHRDACFQIFSLNQSESESISDMPAPPNALTSEEPEYLSTRDRSFLRVLVDFEYKNNQEDILQWQLEFMNQYPDEIPCLVFDHTFIPWRYNFVRANDLHEHWPGEVARAAKGDGRIQLHIVNILGGGLNIRSRMIPMQSSSGALWDGLKRLKRELDEGVGSSAPIHAQIRGRISSLVSVTQRVIHVH